MEHQCFDQPADEYPKKGEIQTPHTESILMPAAYSGTEHGAWKHMKYEATDNVLRRMHTALGRPWDGD